MKAGAIDVSFPDCNPDGTYAPVQCLGWVEYCWCVSPDGKTKPGTGVHGFGDRPDCGRYLIVPYNHIQGSWRGGVRQAFNETNAADFQQYILSNSSK